MGKKIIRVIAVVLIPVVCLYLLTLLLTPKYVNDIPEGSMIAEYYKSEKIMMCLFLVTVKCMKIFQQSRCGKNMELQVT